MDIIAEIVTYKRTEELPRLKRERPLADLRAHASLQPRPLDFRAALVPGPDQWPRLIAAIKRAAPAKGQVVRGPFDPVELAEVYAASGASACAVSTDARYHQGTMAHLEAVSALRRLPVLRHDYIIDEYQLVEARAGGADAVWLIASILSRSDLRRLLESTRNLRMAALVAVSAETDIERALAAGADLLAVDNRDLRSYAVDLTVMERLRPLIPREMPVVAASGIRRRVDVERMQALGAAAVLVGETFLRARREERAARVRDLAGA